MNMIQLFKRMHIHPALSSIYVSSITYKSNEKFVRLNTFHAHYVINPLLQINLQCTKTVHLLIFYNFLHLFVLEIWDVRNRYGRPDQTGSWMEIVYIYKRYYSDIFNLFGNFRMLIEMVDTRRDFHVSLWRF